MANFCCNVIKVQPPIISGVGKFGGKVQFLQKKLQTAITFVKALECTYTVFYAIFGIVLAQFLPLIKFHIISPHIFLY